MKKLMLFVFSAALLFTGCSSNTVDPNKYIFRIYSTPSGAQVTCGGKNFGYTPVDLNFYLDAAVKQKGSLKPSPCILTWVSGATQRAYGTIDLNKFPNGMKITVPRPPNAPNIHLDHQFALQRKQQRNQQQILRNQQQIQSNQKRMKIELNDMQDDLNQQNSNQKLCNQGLGVFCKI